VWVLDDAGRIVLQTTILASPDAFTEECLIRRTSADATLREQWATGRAVMHGIAGTAERNGTAERVIVGLKRGRQAAQSPVGNRATRRVLSARRRIALGSRRKERTLTGDPGLAASGAASRIAVVGWSSRENAHSQSPAPQAAAALLHW
jgi:hypothetical protein